MAPEKEQMKNWVRRLDEGLLIRWLRLKAAGPLTTTDRHSRPLPRQLNKLPLSRDRRQKAVSPLSTSFALTNGK